MRTNLSLIRTASPPVGQTTNKIKNRKSLPGLLSSPPPCGDSFFEDDFSVNTSTSSFSNLSKQSTPLVSKPVHQSASSKKNSPRVSQQFEDIDEDVIFDLEDEDFFAAEDDVVHVMDDTLAPPTPVQMNRGKDTSSAATRTFKALSKLHVLFITYVCWLVVFYVPFTARSFRDDIPIYCPLRKT